MTVIVHVLFEQTQPLPEVLAPPIFALNYGRALCMAYGDRTRIRASRSAGHLGRSDHVRSKKTAKVAGHPSYSSGIVNASFPIGANTAVWQESISSRKATKALRAVVPLLRGPQISEYNRNLSEMHWVAAKERTWWRGSRPREAGRDGSACSG